MKIICISGKAQHGKDTLAKILDKKLQSENKKVLIAHYGDLVKYIAQKFFNWNGEKDESGRTLLQYVGTDIVRTQIPDYWVDFIIGILKLFPDKWDYVLIPDCRFPNEIDKMKHNFSNVISVRVDRGDFSGGLSAEQLIHPSETALDHYGFDIKIDNKEGLVEFLDKVLSIEL